MALRLERKTYSHYSRCQPRIKTIYNIYFVIQVIFAWHYAHCAWLIYPALAKREDFPIRNIGISSRFPPIQISPILLYSKIIGAMKHPHNNLSILISLMAGLQPDQTYHPALINWETSKSKVDGGSMACPRFWDAMWCSLVSLIKWCVWVSIYVNRFYIYIYIYIRRPRLQQGERARE